MRDAFWKFFSVVGFLVTLFFIIGLFAVGRGLSGLMGHEPVAVVSHDSILVLDLKGMIIDGKKFLKDLRRYRDEERIKGVLIRVDSPGGVVGPSQEIYAELKYVREQLKKPVVMSVNGLAASGAYYSAVAGDWIVTNPGAIVGSIGVIMEFANLEGLYDWAKIQRYSLTTGKYKDSGAEYRKMNDDERNLLQSMINEVLDQFVKAVAEGRKLPEDKVRAIADGRILTGQSAVNLGLADQVGTFTDAVVKIGELSGLGKDPELFSPTPDRPNPLDFFMGAQDEEDSVNGSVRNTETSVAKIVDQFTKRRLLGKPLFLMPGALD